MTTIAMQSVAAKTSTATVAASVGMGCTRVLLSDRLAYTVVTVAPGGKTATVRRDAAPVKVTSAWTGNAIEFYPEVSTAEVITIRHIEGNLWRSLDGKQTYIMGRRVTSVDTSILAYI